MLEQRHMKPICDAGKGRDSGHLYMCRMTALLRSICCVLLCCCLPLASPVWLPYICCELASNRIVQDSFLCFNSLAVHLSAFVPAGPVQQPAHIL